MQWTLMQPWRVKMDILHSHAALSTTRDIENVDTQLVQLVVLVSMLPTMPGMIVLVDYSNDEMRPMVATALPALDWKMQMVQACGTISQATATRSTARARSTASAS